MSMQDIKKKNEIEEVMVKPYTPSIMAIPQEQWETFLEAVITTDLNTEILYEKTQELIKTVEDSKNGIVTSIQNSQEKKINDILNEVKKLDIKDTVTAEHGNRATEATTIRNIVSEILKEVKNIPDIVGAVKVKYLLIGAMTTSILSILLHLR